MYRILYILTSFTDLDTDWFNKLYYIYQHFQDSEKMYQLDPKANIPVPDDNSLYPYINNDIEYGLFQDIVDSYYLDSKLKTTSTAIKTVTHTNRNLPWTIILFHAHMHMIT